MKTFKIIIWVIYVICVISEMILTIYNHTHWETLEAIYCLLWVAVMLLFLKA